MRWKSRNASAADGSDWADDAVVVGNDVDTTGHPLVDVVRRRSIAPEQRQATMKLHHSTVPDHRK
jgi:hypothetical protein